MNSFSRIFYLALGWVMVALGVIGAFLPVMPTTPFLLVAAWAFSRGSPRFEAWLLGHPRFGPHIRAWREQGAIPTRAKWVACSMMALGYCFALWTLRPSLPMALGLFAVLFAAALFMVTRPAPRP